MTGSYLWDKIAQFSSHILKTSYESIALQGVQSYNFVPFREFT